MRKTGKEETPSTDKAALMLAEGERAVAHLKDLVEGNELEAYLEGFDINGSLVEESDDITPEQVAILGAYVLAVQVRDNLLKISQGKKVTPRKTSTTKVSEIIAFDINKGKVTKVGKHGKIPDEVKKALKEFLKEMEDDE